MARKNKLRKKSTRAITFENLWQVAVCGTQKQIEGKITRAMTFENLWQVAVFGVPSICSHRP